MRHEIVVGRPLATEWPSFVHELSARFDVLIFDVMDLRHTLQAMTGRRFAALIVLSHRTEFVIPMKMMMAERGAQVDHLVALSRDGTVGAEANLGELHFCDCLDGSRTDRQLVDPIESTIIDCPAHQPRPTETPLRGHLGSNYSWDSTPSTALDAAIESLVAQGLPDREIANRLHYSAQTIRNRISRMLHDQGLENRTELAVAHLLRGFQGLLQPGQSSD